VSAVKTRGQRKIRTGHVISDRMDKTIVVEIERLVKHSLYKKYIRRRSHLYVHDEKNTGRIGDKVRVVETRPLSRQKRWRLLEIVRRAE
jgi:small subunit ribosomal protein S17